MSRKYSRKRYARFRKERRKSLFRHRMNRILSDYGVFR